MLQFRSSSVYHFLFVIFHTDLSTYVAAKIKNERDKKKMKLSVQMKQLANFCETHTHSVYDSNLQHFAIDAMLFGFVFVFLGNPTNERMLLILI